MSSPAVARLSNASTTRIKLASWRSLSAIGEIAVMYRGRVIENGAAEAFFATPKTEEAPRFV
jgi:ABC-type microcin C transport system duplicated ATPase subunit YejF